MDVFQNSGTSIRYAPPTRPDTKLVHLPLSQDQRSVVDSLLNTFKRKGEYDLLRKAVYAKYDASVSDINRWRPIMATNNWL